MQPYKEELIKSDLPFPVDIFIRDSNEENIVAEPHWHDCLEILYMLEGTAKQQVNDKHFIVGRHDIVILNEGDIHSTYCFPEENTRILVIKFLSDILGNSYSRLFESKYILAFLNNRSNQISHVSDTLINSTAIHHLMMGLYEEFTKKNAAYEIYIKGYIYQLIACLIRDGILHPHHALKRQEDMVKLDKLFRFIEEHYKEKIDLQKAANMLNMSYSYFSRYFKKVTGSTFKAYIDFVRICEVEKLILSTDINISQAAYEVGFYNVSSFNRIFKRVRGYQPGEIKRSKTAKF